MTAHARGAEQPFTLCISHPRCIAVGHPHPLHIPTPITCLWQRTVMHQIACLTSSEWSFPQPVHTRDASRTQKRVVGWGNHRPRTLHHLPAAVVSHASDRPPLNNTSTPPPPYMQDLSHSLPKPAATGEPSPAAAGDSQCQPVLLSRPHTHTPAHHASLCQDALPIACGSPGTWGQVQPYRPFSTAMTSHQQHL